MKAYNELTSSRAANRVSCRYDSRSKQSGINYSASERKKQVSVKKKKS